MLFHKTEQVKAGEFSHKTKFYGEFTPDPCLAHILFTDENGTTRTLNSFNYFEMQLYKKIKRGFSPTVLIIGQQGIGKSFLGLFLAYIHTLLMRGEKFDFKAWSFYDILNVISKVQDAYNQAFLIDEAGDILNVKEWYEKTHLAVNSMLNTQRFRKNLYIFISPFACDIDKSVRKHFDFQLFVTAHGRYKAKRYFKKYDQSDPNKAAWPIFLDDMGIRLSELPKDYFEEYTEYSTAEKQKLLAKRVKQVKKAEEQNSYIANYLRGLKDA